MCVDTDLLCPFIIYSRRTDHIRVSTFSVKIAKLQEDVKRRGLKNGHRVCPICASPPGPHCKSSARFRTFRTRTCRTNSSAKDPTILNFILQNTNLLADHIKMWSFEFTKLQLQLQFLFQFTVYNHKISCVLARANGSFTY